MSTKLLKVAFKKRASAFFAKLWDWRIEAIAIAAFLFYLMWFVPYLLELLTIVKF